MNTNQSLKNFNKFSHAIGKNFSPGSSAEMVMESLVNYYEGIIDCMPGNVYWLDQNAIAVGCNRNVLKMFGFKSIVEFKGLTFEEMGKIGNWLPETMLSFKKDTLEVIKTGKARLNVEEPPIPDANGNIIYFLTSRVPLFDPQGVVIGVVGISIDITERKKMEEELKKAKEQAEISNHAKTEFLENMRHDIRTPLSGIVGIAALLRNETNKDKIQECTEKLDEASTELLRFLNEILESINVASGEIPLLKKRFDLRTILSNALKLNRPKAVEKGLSLKLSFDDAIPNYLMGDPIRIYRIVHELLVNALKFTKEGSISVTVKSYKKEDRNIVINITVEDTGPGIPPEKQQELFVRFKRFTPSYQGIYKGTGLGLTIIKQFIDDLQGEIYVNSHPSHGTKFTCMIPMKIALLDEPLEDALLFKEYSHALTPPKVHVTSGEPMVASKIFVLVVEDQSIVAAIAESILKALGCEVSIASTGEAALELIEKNHYHLILMDIGLPDIDGFEITKRIRNLKNSRNQQTSIVGLTAHADPEKKQSSLDVGMNMILSKPLTPEVASHLLEDILPTQLQQELAI